MGSRRGVTTQPPLLPRPLSRLALGVALLLVVGACARRPNPGPVTLHVLMTDDWVTAPYIAAVRDFERSHPGVSVATDKIPIARVADTVRADIGNGNPPDVAQYHAFAAAAQGLAQQVDDLWKRSLDPAEFLPGAVEDVTWAGHRYGVALDSNALLLMYNATLIAAAHRVPPGPTTTFGDLESLAASLTAADGSRRGVTMATSDWWTYGWIRANGGEVLVAGPDGRPKPTLNDPAVVQALVFLVNLVHRNVAFPPRSSVSSSGDALALFRSGEAALYATGSWDLASLRTVTGATFHAAPMPRGSAGQPESTVLGGTSLFIPKVARNRSLAFQFMLALTSDQYALRFAAENGRLPVRPRLFQNAVFRDPDLQVFVQNLSAAHPYTLEAFPPAKTAFQQALDAILRGGRSPAEALDQAQATALAAVGASP